VSEKTRGRENVDEGKSAPREGEPSSCEEKLFETASDLAAEERSAYLERACAGNEELRVRVERLLSVHEGDIFMKDRAEVSLAGEWEQELARWQGEAAGDRIGGYQLVEVLGSGGFGTVWKAKQERPVRREVALKIIKLGMDTREVIARFEQERQALALMDHPSIAQVFDAGATESGRPFFVMELIKGARFTDYCDAENLGPEARLALFVEVCDAVQHAHQKGLIHRDLKASNILVTGREGEAVPKIIDFGVAKATQGRLTDLTLHTGHEHMIGTPACMSPEQAAGSVDIDTRSDIYALGVLLYELLAGRPPFAADELTRVTPHRMRRMICEREAPIPSTALQAMPEETRTKVAQRRRSDAGRLVKVLRGDLDWIVMMALEKDRERRYQTAQALAADVRRYLAREPVTARPPSATYRFRRLVQRNKLGFAAGSAVAVAIVAGLVVSLAQTRRANAALAGLRQTAPLFAAQARSLVAHERIDEAIERLEYASRLVPEEAAYVVAQGNLRQSQLRLAEAAAAYRAALRIEPRHTLARTNLALTERLLAAQGSVGPPPREGLAELLAAMQREQRPAAELLPVARLLGEQKQVTLEVWRERLATLPIAPDRPLAQRLTMGDNGLLSLDLNGTAVADLTPLEDMPVSSLNLTNCRQVSDLRPLRGLPLRRLFLRGTAVADLSPLSELLAIEELTAPEMARDISPLRGMRLQLLDLAGSRVTDIAPLRGMPMRRLSLTDIGVADLSPLAGLPLEYLDARNIPASDLSPLAGMPLDRLMLGPSKVRDLGFLHGMPLTVLVIDRCPQARNFAVLSSLKKLERLALPETYRKLPAAEQAAIEALRELPGLQQVTADFVAGSGFALNESATQFWAVWDKEKEVFSSLRAGGYRFDFRRESDGRKYLRIQGRTFSDLSLLRGLPLAELSVYQTAVSDLAPLAGMPLKMLTIGFTAVSDLSPLRGMPLEHLQMSGCPIESLEPIAALPLKSILINQCEKLQDFELLAKIPTLEEIWLPLHAEEIEALRKLPGLQRLSYSRPSVGKMTPASKFWETWDGRPWYRALKDAGMKFEAWQRVSGFWHVTVTDPRFSDAAIFRGTSVREITISSPAFRDVAALAGLPLTALDLGGSGVTDWQPLRRCTTLEVLRLPAGAEKIDVLRQLPNLRQIGIETLQPAQKFWEERAGRGAR